LRRHGYPPWRTRTHDAEPGVRADPPASGFFSYECPVAAGRSTATLGTRLYTSAMRTATFAASLIVLAGIGVLLPNMIWFSIVGTIVAPVFGCTFQGVMQRSTCSRATGSERRRALTCNALLPALFLASTTYAAPGLKPGGMSDFMVELPRELREMAGRGQLSPVTHVLVTIAVPANLDAAHQWPVLIINATSPPRRNSSRRLLSAYADVALNAGWILVAADPTPDVSGEKDDVSLRLALNTAALAVLDLQWPAAFDAPLAFGGFSGGAKYSPWLAAAFASRGRNVIGVYLAGVNTNEASPAAEHFNLDANFKRIPIFLQSGEKDEIATPADHIAIRDALRRRGFKNVRLEYFSGTHEVDPLPLNKALEWFRQFGALPVPTK
jgi:predicted esterase